MYVNIVLLPLRPKCLLSKIIKNKNHRTVMSSHVLLLFPWRFDPILGHGLVLRGSAITLNENTTLSRSPLDEWSARLREIPDNMQHSQEKHVYTRSRIRTSNPSNRTAVDQRLTCGQRGRLPLFCSLTVHNSACYSDRKHRMRGF